jgi:hypothetical protein
MSDRSLSPHSLICRLAANPSKLPFFLAKHDHGRSPTTKIFDSTLGCFLYFDLELDFTSAAQLALAQEAGCCVLTLTLTLTRLDLYALAALRPHAGPHVGSRIPDADSSVSKPNILTLQ